ncbi:putative membrane protein YdjX (TVP38/TMEM64 family) [Aeromicrobium panaciterrae]|uniref:Membrane protein YdjX (TVP38/TMEM64 family) n=1 Tax=Aeromicrobium panaciterrae TaxID=363861 RepID=A0ABU1ULB0_9ACTN|nr:hypothetical protein [Aeromicrobium panaciterrae]MDR7085948.1 putative membrane protein YdjX (TVP38/TMEM64 family) [Aeromicrobium panaciterrae]
MDYTPIGVGRVLAAFALTIVVAVLPVAAVLISHSPATISGPDGYGGWVLGLGSVAMAAALFGLSRLAVATKRRSVGRPSQA